MTLEDTVAAYPSCTSLDENGWYTYLRQAPEGVWHQLVAELVKAALAAEGERRVGRRPRPTGTIEDVRRLLEPSYSEEPFRETLTKLIGGRSVRGFAARIPVNHGYLLRLLSGERRPSVPTIIAIARAARVRPEHFLEYRTAVVQQVIADAFEGRPALSVTAFRRVTEVLGG